MWDNNLDVKTAAEICNISVATAKSILKLFVEKGQIGKKKHRVKSFKFDNVFHVKALPVTVPNFLEIFE